MLTNILLINNAYNHIRVSDARANRTKWTPKIKHHYPPCAIYWYLPRVYIKLSTMRV